MNKIAAVTGANRGIGKEIARQFSEKAWKVILIGRNLESLDLVQAELKGDTEVIQVDLSEKNAEEIITKGIEKSGGRLDVLINNAGIISRKSQMDFDVNEFETVFQTNFFGVLRATKAALPFLQQSSDPRIVNMSSDLGRIKSLTGGRAAYGLSKWLLNGHSILLANELASLGIQVFAMSPGWVKTDMGGSEAPLHVSEGADTAVWLSETNNAESGKMYRNRKVISW